MRELLKEKQRHSRYLALTLVLAVLVAAGVGGLFHQPAVAKTYQITALTCTAEAPVGLGYAGFFVHTHNEDCFDENGNLVCPLPEIKAHVHDETCYTTTAVQTCGHTESDGHQHTEACYTRVQGDLICEQSTEPVLDEAGNVLAEGHVHTDECFAWTEELSCGMEEGEGAHHHSESCFEYVTSLSCDMPEVILHVHSEDCYQKNEDGSIYVDEDGNTFLICGLPEVTEHVHGSECFTVYELDDEENTNFFTTEDADTASDTENTEGDESGFIFLFPEEEESEEEEQPAENQETDPEAAEGADADGETDADAADSTDPSADEENPDAADIPMPPQSFTGETDGVIVTVEAPEGAFPEGTTMVVSPVEMDDDTLSNVTGAVESSGEKKVVTAQAVDISFFDADGNLIEPKLPIKVSMKSALVSESENVALVHLAETGAAETAENETEILEAPATPVAKVVADVQVVENPDEDNEIQFESDAFSVYVLVGTETITAEYLTADGRTLTVTVSTHDHEAIPATAVLEVTEIGEEDEGWNERSVRLAEVLSNAYGNVTISDLRALTINILEDGTPVETDASFEVKFGYNAVLNTEDTAEYYYDEEAGRELRPDPEEQISHFAVIQYIDGIGTILNSEIKDSGNGIISSISVAQGLGEFDLVYVYEYETVPAC